MYKLSWARINDRFHRTFVVVPDVHALFELYHVVQGYGMEDGCVPVEVKVTNLDGDEVDMTKGLAEVAGQGTYSSRH
jgi:hypothetical protein